MSKVNSKIRKILAEAQYEDLGPAVVSPWATAVPNAAASVKPAHAPVATNPVTGAKSLSSDNPAVAGESETMSIGLGEDEEEDDVTPEPKKKAKKPVADEDDEVEDDEEGDEDDDEDMESFNEMLKQLREDEVGAGPAAANPVPATPPGVPSMGASAAPVMPAVEDEDDEDDEDDDEKVTVEEVDVDDDKKDELTEDETCEKCQKAPCECPVDVSSDENAMFKGEKLPESFKAKATAIFRSTVARVVREERKRTSAKYIKVLEEAVAVLRKSGAKKQRKFETKLTEQVDLYLNYVVENWMESNKLAVERGIRAELTEDFIRGLKKLFTEHYIEVPENKVDVLKSMEREMGTLGAKLNEQVQINVKQRASIIGMKKDSVLRVVSQGLAATQVEKLRGLAEGVEYTNRREFSKRLMDLRESYFSGKTERTERKRRPITEAVSTTPDNGTTAIDLYCNSLTKLNSGR